MKYRIALVTIVTAFGVVIASAGPLQAQQATDPTDHSAHHPAASATETTPTPPATAATRSMTSPAKLDALVEKMNSAKGAAKTEAIAELLTALVQDRQACEPMMAKMMKMMGGANDTMPMKPPPK